MKNLARKELVILGAGISGLSLAAELDHPLVLIEKEEVPGGLCRSFEFSGVMTDIGPHIIFSKNMEVLNRHSTRIPTSRLRRMNRIFYNGVLVKYPFENDLFSLPADIRDSCVRDFITNPYKDSKIDNMHQFFLKNFGESISQEYLIPYNKKIWKYDPAFLDLQMVERIPKPPIEDVLNSAKGIPSEGYKHQLFFFYPSKGGFQSLIDDYVNRLKSGQELKLKEEVISIYKSGKEFRVETTVGIYETTRIVSTIPLPELISKVDAPSEIFKLAKQMLYNSIHIVLFELDRDVLEDQFALYVPDDSIIFHRLSRLNFLGSEYVPKSKGAVLMCEITFRPDSYLASMSTNKIIEETQKGIEKILQGVPFKVNNTMVRTFEKAYVIYDLEHRQRTDKVLSWLKTYGITATGRFGKFEYQNSDKVVEESIALAKDL